MKHETLLRDDMEIYDLDLLEPGAVQSLWNSCSQTISSI